MVSPPVQPLNRDNRIKNKSPLKIGGLNAIFPEAEGRLNLELQVFGFRRALGRRSSSVEELLMLTFELLHAAAKAKGGPYRAQR
jgi:hypothetical protein